MASKATGMEFNPSDYGDLGEERVIDLGEKRGFGSEKRLVKLLAPEGRLLVMSDGTLEGLKWLALVLMTLDHINKDLFKASLPGLFEVGRLAMPLFVFVLAYNLARPTAFARGVYVRTMSRLAVFGLVAAVPAMALGGLIGGWWPLNILFTLLAITATLYLIELGTTASYVAATCVFVLGGSSVEFWWPAMSFGLAVWWYCKRSSLVAAMLAGGSLAALVVINGNHWALATLPLLFVASHLNLRLPRVRWFFYAYYPAHLAAIWLIRIPMAQAGYVFS